MTRDEARAKVTVQEVRDYIAANREDGMTCPCCDRWLKVYKRALNVSMARSLIWLHHEAGMNRDWVNVPAMAPKWLLRSREMPKLAHWGFVEERPKDPSDTHKRTSGFWRPTLTGTQFVQRQIRVPRRVFLYNNEVQGWDTEDTDIIGALGTKFDYAELMAPG